MSILKTTVCQLEQPSVNLKGYSSGQSHFSEINAKLAEENEFVTHFVQKCLETRENERNVVLNEFSEALGNRSEIIRILVLLAMTTADDDASGSNSVREDVARFFVVLQTKWGFWFAKSKAINFSFKVYFDRSICNFQRLAGQKTILVRSSSKFKSLQHAGTLFNSIFKEIASRRTSLSEVCSMYWQKYKSQIVGLCSFNNF